MPAFSASETMFIQTAIYKEITSEKDAQLISTLF